MSRFYYIFVFYLLLLLYCFVDSLIIELPNNAGSGNNSVISDYPSSTTSTTCSYQIPISIVKQSNDPSLTLLNVNISIGTLQVPYLSDSTMYTLYTNTISLGSSITNITFIDTSSSNSIYAFFIFTLTCNEFKPSLSYSILDSGIFYNTLAFKIKLNSLEIDKDIKLDFDTPVTTTQHYLGDRSYFVSFHNNIGSFFQNELITINLLMGSTPCSIVTNTPYKLSLNPSFNSNISYPTQSLYESFFPPVLEFTSSSFMDSYFSVIANGDEIINEPFLVRGSSVSGSGDYLATFKSINPISSIFYVYALNSIIYQISYFQQPSTTSEPSVSYSLDFTTNFYNYALSLSNYRLTNSPVYFGSPLKSYGYPFGFYSVLNNIITYSFISAESKSLKNLTITQKYGINLKSLHSDSFDLTDSSISSFNSVNIDSYQASLLPNNRLLLKFTLSSSIIIRSVTIYISNDQVYDIFPLASISTNYNFLSNVPQKVEIIIPRIDIFKYTITNEHYQDTTYYTGVNYYYLVSNQFINLKNLTNLDSDSLSNFNYFNGFNSVSFLYNDLKVTNIRVSNKMYIKLNNYPIDRELKVSFIWSDYIENEKKDTFYSYFNSTSQQFEIEFNIPKNIKSGNVGYTISLDSFDKLNYYSYSLSLENQLRILESKNIDIFGPIITKIEKLVAPDYGWYFTISDSSNGFKNGWIIVGGSIDRTERNFSIDSSNRISGDQFNGVYLVQFAVTCLTQNHTIINGYFQDTEGYSNEIDINGVNNALIYKLYNQDYYSLLYLSVQSQCNTPDNQEIKLGSYFVSPVHVVYNNSVTQRKITIRYTATHPDGISKDFLPMVFASVNDFKFFNSSNTIISSINSSSITFITEMVLPHLFGINQNGIYLSIYGIVTNRGIIGGFKLADSIVTTGFGLNLISISDSSKLSSTGSNGVWIYGQFLNFATDFKIQYNDINEGYQSISATNISGSTAFIPNIRATSKPIQIIAGYNQGYSEPFTIYPEYYDLIDQGTPSNDSPLCKGSPLCGGPSKGQCYTTGCRCINGFVGVDCLSQIIEVPPPTIDESNPSTNITISNEIQFTSIVSIVGIKELSIDGVTQVNRYLFEKWEYRMLNNDSNTIRYSYNSIIKKDNEAVSNINVTLEWYNNPTTVYFANNEINLNPSTIKYTIEVDKYPFSSKLNTLQLIFKVSIQSNNSESCSDKQNNLQDNLDTFNLQVDNHSFYGRFIQRAFIDSYTVVKVSNSFLDPSSIGLSNENSHQKSQSYVGVNIPAFDNSVIYDPDFSVILNPNSANSNCKDNGGLTGGQLAGIIVGSIAFFIVVVIIVCAIIYKSPGCLNVKIKLYKLFRKSKL